jgi:hypothetical protein
MTKFECNNKEYTSKKAVVNGVNGRIWTRTSLEDGARVHNGKVFLRSFYDSQALVCSLIDDTLDFAVN